MRVRVAYVEEPPFYWTGDDGGATGADIEVAKVVLGSIGATPEFRAVTFDELLPGVQSGAWEMNVPIFLTPERAERVAFSVPVWTLGDGFVVAQGNPKELTNYEAFLARADARLGVIPGQVQFYAAKAAGISAGQIAEFTDQPSAVAALLTGAIDAFAATAVGNRVIVEQNSALSAVDLPVGEDAPVGAFSFGTTSRDLLSAVNSQLREYLGSPDHRVLMARYGISGSEIDAIL